MVSGLTVMISLAGLFLTGIDVFSGLAIGTITVVGVAVLGSLTVLPARCRCWAPGWTGAGSRSWAAAAPPRAASAFWEGWPAGWWPGPSLAGGTVALAARRARRTRAGLRLDSPGFHDLPAGVPVVQELMATQQAFPGGPAPAEVVVTGHDLNGPAVQHAVTGLQARARRPAAGAAANPSPRTCSPTARCS